MKIRQLLDLKIVINIFKKCCAIQSA